MKRSGRGFGPLPEQKPEMELPIMQKIANKRELFGQIGAACIELARGCEHAQLAELGVDEWGYLVEAFREMLNNVEKARENALSSDSFAVVDEPDAEIVALFDGTHDGDTQPANEPPTPELCKCGHLEREHMPPLESLHTISGTIRTGRNICCFCDCERFER